MLFRSFDCEDNHLIVLTRNGRHDLGKASKVELARKLVAQIVQSYQAATASDAARMGHPQRGSATA